MSLQRRDVAATLLRHCVFAGYLHKILPMVPEQKNLEFLNQNVFLFLLISPYPERESFNTLGANSFLLEQKRKGEKNFDRLVVIFKSILVPLNRCSFCVTKLIFHINMFSFVTDKSR